MYANPSKGIGGTYPKGRSSGGSSSSAPHPGAAGRGGGRFDPLSIAGCFHCDDPKHTMRHCKLPINTEKAA